jgi:hypothetical protein
MTKDEILQERKWLMTKANKSNPMYGFRLLEYNRQVSLYNKSLTAKAKEAIKSLKVGDIVYLPERYNRKGLWRVDRLMQKNVLLTAVGESDFKGRLKCSAELLIKVEAEDETLINSLDDIGLV